MIMQIHKSRLSSLWETPERREVTDNTDQVESEESPDVKYAYKPGMKIPGQAVIELTKGKRLKNISPSEARAAMGKLKESLNEHTKERN